jgi:hypothetical protein
MDDRIRLWLNPPGHLKSLADLVLDASRTVVDAHSEAAEARDVLRQLAAVRFANAYLASTARDDA